MNFRCKTLLQRIALTALVSTLLLTLGTPALGPFSVLPTEIEGQQAAGIEPGVCVGFDSLEQRWGQSEGLCPANHAYYGVDDPAGKEGPASRIRVHASCCPLPAKDILSDQHEFHVSECPRDAIATGSRTTANGSEVSLRCTKINTKRYTLGEARPGVYWGTGSAGFKGSERIEWSNIPASIRLALGRNDLERWDIDGCVGYPWGSVLTKKSTKHCAGFAFRQLQFSGLDGDPAKGTAVKMIQECTGATDTQDPHASNCS